MFGIPWQYLTPFRAIGPWRLLAIRDRRASEWTFRWVDMYVRCPYITLGVEPTTKTDDATSNLEPLHPLPHTGCHRHPHDVHCRDWLSIDCVSYEMCRLEICHSHWYITFLFALFLFLPSSQLLFIYASWRFLQLMVQFQFITKIYSTWLFKTKVFFIIMTMYSTYVRAYRANKVWLLWIQKLLISLIFLDKKEKSPIENCPFQNEINKD